MIALVKFSTPIRISLRLQTHDNYIKGLTLTFLHGKLLKVDTTTISDGFPIHFCTQRVSLTHTE